LMPTFPEVKPPASVVARSGCRCEHRKRYSERTPFEFHLGRVVGKPVRLSPVGLQSVRARNHGARRVNPVQLRSWHSAFRGSHELPSCGSRSPRWLRRSTIAHQLGSTVTCQTGQAIAPVATIQKYKPCAVLGRLTIPSVSTVASR
jgi:hypothetical protein